MSSLQILNELFLIIRDYSTSTFSLQRVRSDALGILQLRGHSVGVSGRSGLIVDNHMYNLLKQPGWSRYDIRCIY